MDEIPDICPFCKASASAIFSDQKRYSFGCGSYWDAGEIHQSQECKIKYLEVEIKRLRAEVEKFSDAYDFLTDNDSNATICYVCHGVFDIDEMHYLESDDAFVCDDCYLEVRG